MDQVIIRLVDLPVVMRGAVREDENGDYNVYINARLSEDQRVAVLRHEVEHIRRGHLHDDTKSVAQKEAEAENRPIGARYSALR